VESTLISSLLDFGALGLFAGFLAWQYTKQQRRLEMVIEKFQETVKTQEVAHNAAEDVIRQRYDQIIARHEAQRNAIYEDVVKKLDDHTRLIADIHEGVRSIQGARRFDEMTDTILDR
jgi:uncharacterized iron-regulated protein